MSDTIIEVTYQIPEPVQVKLKRLFSGVTFVEGGPTLNGVTKQLLDGKEVRVFNQTFKAVKVETDEPASTPAPKPMRPVKPAPEEDKDE